MALLDAAAAPVQAAAMLRLGDFLLSTEAGTAGTALVAQHGDDRIVLWQGAASAVDLVPDGQGGALALFQGTALLAVRPAGARAPECAVLAEPPELPDRLFPTPGGPFGVFASTDPAPRLAAFEQDGGWGDPITGPALMPGQAVSHVAIGPDGSLVVAADDAKLGFHLWGQADAGWTPVTENGAGRYGCNAVVHDVCPWGGYLALAVGPRRDSRQVMFGLRLGGEVLLLEPDNRLSMLIGELRGQSSGLLVPHAGVANHAAWEQDLFTRLAVYDGSLIGGLERADGTGVLYAFDDQFRTTTLGKFQGPLSAIDTAGGVNALVAGA